MRLRLGKVTVADVLAAQPVTTNLLKFMRASIKMIGVSNLQSFIASMTQKLTLSDISDESISKNVSVSCAYTQGKREQFSGFNRTLDAINNVFRKFSAFHDETGRLNVDGMNIISNDGSNKLNRSRKARVSYKVQRTINASLNAATSTRAVSSNPNFVTRQKIEIIFG